MRDPRSIGLSFNGRTANRLSTTEYELAALRRNGGGGGGGGGGETLGGSILAGPVTAATTVTTGAPQWGRLGIGVAAPATTGDIRSLRLGLGMNPNHYLDMTVEEAAGDTATPKKGISLIQTFNDNATFPVSAGVHFTFLWENTTAVAPGANFPGLRATTYRGGYTGTALAGGTTHAVTAEHVITGVKDDGSGDGLGSTVQEAATYYGTMVDRTILDETTTDLWAFDNKLHSTQSSHQNQYIIGYSQLVNQYNATSPATFNTAGAGSNGMQIVTSPRGISDAGFTAGISTYAVDFGLIISGVSGLLANVNNSSATRGFNTALSIGDGTTTWSPHPSRFGTGISVTSWDNSGVGIYIGKRWAGTSTPALSLGWDTTGAASTAVGDGIDFGGDVKLWRQNTDSLGMQTGDMFLAGGFQVTGNSATRGFINFIEQTTDPVTGVAAGACRLYAINDGTDTVLSYVDSVGNIHPWGSGTSTAVVNITAAASPTKTPIVTGHATGLAQNQTLIHTNGEIFLGDGVVAPVHTGRITSYTKDPTGTVDPGTTTDSYYPIFGRHFTPAATYLTGSARTAHFIGYHAAEGSAGGANDYPSVGNVGVWSQMFVGLLTNGSTTTEALGTCHAQTMDVILHRIGDRHAYDDPVTNVPYTYDNEYAIARWRFVDDTSKTAYNAGDTRHGRMWGLDFTMHGAPDDTNAPEQFQGLSLLANYYCATDPTVSHSALISGQTWPSLRENTTNHAAHTGRTYPLQVGFQLAGKSGSEDLTTIEDYGYEVALKIGGSDTSWPAVTKSIIHTGIDVTDWGQAAVRIGDRYTGAAETAPNHILINAAPTLTASATSIAWPTTATYTFGSSAGFRAAVFSPAVSLTANPNANPLIVFQTAPSVSYAASVTSAETYTSFSAGGTWTNPSGAVTKTGGFNLNGLLVNPTLAGANNATTATTMYGVNVTGTPSGSSWTVTNWGGLFVQIPATGATIGTIYGVRLADYGARVSTAAYGIFSSGLDVQSVHGGPMKIGAVSAISGYAAANPTLELERTAALPNNGADGYVAALALDPAYSGSYTLDRHNYIDLQDPATSGTTITDACVFRFDASIGAHKALASNGTVATTITSLGPTGAATTIQGWMKLNINGVVRHVPFW